MTKREIEEKVVLYAKKAHYNSDMGNQEIKDRIHTTVKAIVALAFTFPNQGKDFRFGTNQKVILMLADMRKDITAIVAKRTNVAKDISNRMNKGFEVDITDWDSNDWIGSIQHGKSYAQRLGVYVARLKFEIEAYVAVGMVQGLDALKISDWFMTNIESPHTNNAILDAVGYSSVRASGILKVGVGGITSAYKSIVRLDSDMFMSAYNISNRTTWGQAGLYKYVKTMGDSLVCATCQANVGIIFPASEYVVQVHNRCRCMEFPILV